MNLHCVRGGPGRSSGDGGGEGGLSPTPYTVSSDGDMLSPPPPAVYRYTPDLRGQINIFNGRATTVASPLVQYSRSGSRCDLSPGPGHDEYSHGGRVRPQSGLYRYGGERDDFYPSTGTRDCPIKDDICQDDRSTGREDCCRRRQQDEQLMLSSSSDKDDSAYHEPLYYNCGSSPSGEDETGLSSGFYRVQDQSLYEVRRNLYKFI
jgi:hypothetical protein